MKPSCSLAASCSGRWLKKPSSMGSKLCRDSGTGGSCGGGGKGNCGGRGMLHTLQAHVEWRKNTTRESQ